jgi:phospholipid-transporting ATPase
MGNNGPVESTRTVFFGWQSNANKYVDNSISTTKYSYLSFIPHAVFLQFLYPRNFIFLANAILQSIRAISNLSPWTAILPLIVVILVSVIR